MEWIDGGGEGSCGAHLEILEIPEVPVHDESVGHGQAWAHWPLLALLPPQASEEKHWPL